jgi:hypothetical protein
MQDFLTPFQDSTTHAATSANVARRSLPVAPMAFFHRQRALLVMDLMHAHITNDVKDLLHSVNTTPAVIPGGTPQGNFSFGIVFLLNINIGGKYIPEAVQASTHGKLAFSWPVVFMLMVDEPVFSTVRFIGRLKVNGTSSIHG